uniref:Paired domain-containing protein n=1 Tax=Anopheles funestus TaxID=62324 RepID=A0A4Y0BVY5_ANOFN
MDANLYKTTDGPPIFALKKKPFVPRKSTSDTDRRHIVKAYLNGGLPRTISDMFGIKLSTVYGIIKNYRNTGKVAAIRRGGNHKKILSPEAAQSVRNWLKEDNTLSLKQLAQKVWEQYHIHVSPSTVAREIRTLRAALQRRKLAVQAKKWNNYIATAGIEALHSNDDSIAEDQSATFVKEEDLSSSDDNEQCADDIDIGETVLTHTDGWDQTVESYKSEDNPLEEIIINESDLSETLMGKKISCDSMAKVIRAEKRVVSSVMCYVF